MTIAEQLMKKGTDAANRAFAAERRRVAHVLRKKGFGSADIAEALWLSRKEVEHLLRPFVVPSQTGEEVGWIMAIVEEIMEKATIDERRRLVLNLQAGGFPLAKIAQLMGLSVQEVENLVRPIAS